MADTPSAFGSKQLEHFRASKRRLPLHPLEKAVLVAVAIHLCFLPWALGTMHVWSQLTSLALSAVGIVLALIPRTYSGDLAPQLSAFSSQLSGPNPQVSGFRFQVSGASSQLPAQHPKAFSPAAQRPDESRRSLGVGGQPSAFRLNPLPRLLKFPLFWLGLLLLAYIAIQALNPSWVWERNERTWWLRRVNDIPWLPTSIDTPFERFNIWRQFIIYASAWLTLCTVWIGFTRRRSLQLLLTVLTLLMVLFWPWSVLASPVYFPTWEWVIWLNSQLKGATSFASFIYKNHAAAYLSLSRRRGTRLGCLAP
jgi:hypothetical protein